MKDFKAHNRTIRQFLLGQLSIEQCEAIEDRIFAEPDFAEEVQIVESELMEQYGAGQLTAAERVLLETKYSNTKANREVMEYEKLFSTFIRSKLEDSLLLTDLKPTESLKPTPKSRNPSFFYFLRTHRILAYASLLITLTVSVIVIWYLAKHQIPKPDDFVDERRRGIELALAELNRPSAATPERVVSTVDLRPSERERGAMARISVGKTQPEALVEFDLNVPQASPREYRAVFLNDRQKELFAVGHLMAQSTTGGPKVRLLVLIKYLDPGDYEISLALLNQHGGADEINSYSFRVVDTGDR